MVDTSLDGVSALAMGTDIAVAAGDAEVVLLTRDACEVTTGQRIGDARPTDATEESFTVSGFTPFQEFGGLVGAVSGVATSNQFGTAVAIGERYVELPRERVCDVPAVLWAVQPDARTYRVYVGDPGARDASHRQVGAVFVFDVKYTPFSEPRVAHATTIFGRVEGAAFGSAVDVVGLNTSEDRCFVDLGYERLVVGAPHEDGMQGAVYDYRVAQAPGSDTERIALVERYDRPSALMFGRAVAVHYVDHFERVVVAASGLDVVDLADRPVEQTDPAGNCSWTGDLQLQGVVEVLHSHAQRPESVVRAVFRDPGNRTGVLDDLTPSWSACGVSTAPPLSVPEPGSFPTGGAGASLDLSGEYMLLQRTGDLIGDMLLAVGDPDEFGGRGTVYAVWAGIDGRFDDGDRLVASAIPEPSACLDFPAPEGSGSEGSGSEGSGSEGSGSEGSGSEGSGSDASEPDLVYACYGIGADVSLSVGIVQHFKFGDRDPFALTVLVTGVAGGTKCPPNHVPVRLKATAGNPAMDFDPWPICTDNDFSGGAVASGVWSAVAGGSYASEIGVGVLVD